jgi:hypothetical protein
MYDLFILTFYPLLWSLMIGIPLYYLYQEKNRNKWYESIHDYQLSDTIMDTVSNNISILLDQPVLLALENNYKSFVLLKTISKLYRKEHIHVVHIINENDDNILEKYCDELEVIYHLYKNNSSGDYLHKDITRLASYRRRQIYEEICTKHNIINILEASDINSLCNGIFHSMFSGYINSLCNFSLTIPCNNLSIIRPFYNLDIDSSESHIIKNNFTNLLSICNTFYPNWKQKVLNEMRLLLSNFSNTVYKNIDTYLVTYKNGFIINYQNMIDNIDINNQLNYMIHMIHYCSTKYNIMMNTQMIECLFDNDLDLNVDNWKIIKHNGKLIFLNRTLCQRYIDSVVSHNNNEYTDKSTVNNTIESFLDMKFFEYYTTVDAGESIVPYSQVFYTNDDFPVELLSCFVFINENGYSLHKISE